MGIRLQSALMVGTQVDEAVPSTNADVKAATQIYTPDIEGTPDFTDGAGVKFLKDTLSNTAIRRRSLIGETVNDGLGTRTLEHKLNLEGPETITFATRLHGSGHSSPVGDGDNDFPPAIRYLFEGLGVRKISGDATESIYGGGRPTYLTFSWFTGDDTTLIRYRSGSCLVQSVSIVFPPAEPAIATWTVMVGHLIARIEQGVFPPFPDPAPPANTVAGYGSMDTLPAAPFIAALMDVAGFARRPGTLTYTITQGLERVGQGNNSVSGAEIFPNNEGRTVTLSGDVFLVDSDTAQEFEDMDRDLSTDDYTFTYGQEAQNTLRFKLFNGVADDGFAPVAKGDQYAHTISVHGTDVAGVGGSEFEIRSS